MKYLFLLLLGMGLAHLTRAQETISGVVINSYDSPKVSFAKVLVAGAITGYWRA